MITSNLEAPSAMAERKTARSAEIDCESLVDKRTSQPTYTLPVVLSNTADFDDCDCPAALLFSQILIAASINSSRMVIPLLPVA